MRCNGSDGGAGDERFLSANYLYGAVASNNSCGIAAGAELPEHNHIDPVWDLFEVHILVFMDVVTLQVVRSADQQHIAAVARDQLTCSRADIRLQCTATTRVRAVVYQLLATLSAC